MQHYRRFCADNPCDNHETQFERFVVFGGSGLRIDMSLPLSEAIERYILDGYADFRRNVGALCGSDADALALLSGVALGDRRTHSALKRARLDREAGSNAVAAMLEAGVLRREKARPNRFSWVNDEDTISDRLHFTSPFLRFWFAFVSPIYRGIKAGDYAEFHARYAARSAEFPAPIFEALSMELIRLVCADDPVREIGGYWDHRVEIDVLARTESDRTIAATCRYVNAKLKKTELARLKSACKQAGLKPDRLILISKKGFSGELRALQSEELGLYSLRHFKQLL